MLSNSCSHHQLKLSRSISYAAVAAHTDQVGRRKLAAMLVEHEPLSSKQACYISSTNVSYLEQPAIDFVKIIRLYAESVARFESGSPYIYPMYGLRELPQAFARLSAVYGGTYMLNKPQCKVEFDDSGKVSGVTSDGETAKCKKVVCDPSYVPDKVKKIGKVARAICIMSHPIPDTNDCHLAQVIIPQKQLNRQSDMYLFCCSYSHNVTPQGKFISFVTTEAETDDPESELKHGVDLLGPVDEIFYETLDRFEPTDDGTADSCFVSTSYDATTHFETTMKDVLAMYTKITGKVLEPNWHVMHNKLENAKSIDEVRDVRLIMDRNSRRSKGVGVACFPSVYSSCQSTLV